jgi:tetratricopeptide (TPR) repeat protein
LGALALCVVSAVGARAQAPAQAGSDDATQRELQLVRELLARAVAEFEGPQQGRSINSLDDIVARLEGLKRGGGLPTGGRDVLAQAYELRARAYYNIGLQEKAADSFRALVQLQPQYALTKDKVSPKVVDFYDSIKRALVGFLAVSSRPPGARVSLNGEFVGLTDFFPVEVLAGEYTLEVAKEGYQSVTKPVSIAARGTETVQEELLRVSAAAAFVTEPAGVELWIDGVLRATTTGSLAPELHETARARGLDPQRASDRVVISNLSLGEHRVEFRRKCWETERQTLSLDQAQDYEIAPVRLTESLASLDLRSDPPGAAIYVDGEPKGQTPRSIEGLCSGPHRIEVKHSSGKFIQHVMLAKDESLSLDCPIRPSLAFLGVVAESAGAERVLGEVEERLLRELARLSTLNFVPAPRETVERILEAERLTRAALVAGAGTSPDLVRKVTETLARALEVQGFLIAVVPEERLQRTVRLHLLAAGNAVSEARDVAFAEGAAYQRFINTVDAKVTVYRPWSGLITVDTRLHQGVPVLRVVPASPAFKAGVQPGDVVQSAGGQPVTSTPELLALVEARKPGDTLALALLGAGGTRVAELTLEQTPQEIPLNDPELLYNKVMMDLRQQVEGYPGSEAAAFARLNLGLAAMHFGDFAAAHDHFVLAVKELPRHPGLSQGTAQYYLGVALERLGYRKEAQDAYAAALSAQDATLYTNDGPAVPLLAQRRVAP